MSWKRTQVETGDQREGSCLTDQARQLQGLEKEHRKVSILKEDIVNGTEKACI
jgi:hypothetical protein